MPGDDQKENCGKGMKRKQIDWNRAAEHLSSSIIQCSLLGAVGTVPLQNIVLPLLTRYNSGEHTPSLYRKIMQMKIPPADSAEFPFH